LRVLAVAPLRGWHGCLHNVNVLAATSPRRFSANITFH